MNDLGEIIIYQIEDGLTKINVNMQNETVWLSLDQMAELFQRDKSTILFLVISIWLKSMLLNISLCT